MDSKEVLSIYMKAFAENLKRVRTDKFDKMTGVSKNSGLIKVIIVNMSRELESNH